MYVCKLRDGHASLIHCLGEMVEMRSVRIIY